ncbi:N-formylglutamate amidohydrolase [compost metagenome]
MVNGRFKGGYNTRHYGNPASGVHTIQLEMCQSLYMNEAYPYEYREVTAQPVQKLIGEMLAAGLSHLQSRAK